MPAHQPSTPDDDSRRKTTLSCPCCGHESDVTGDWIVHSEHGRQVIDCPVCTTTITKRLRDLRSTPQND